MAKSKAQQARDLLAANPAISVPEIATLLNMKWPDVRRALSSSPPGIMQRKPAPQLADSRVGRLTVLELVSGDCLVRRRWRCVCDCGAVRVVSEHNLVRGTSSSCGCRAADSARARAKHRMSGTAEYRAWRKMIERCDDDNDPNYGGRGIVVCPRWRHSFVAFYSDMGPRPSTRHSIDRIDVNGNYEPGNCRWATPREQARNTRVNRLLTIDGVTRLAIDWANIAGINQALITKRLRRGLTPKEAVFAPVQNGRFQPGHKRNCHGSV